MTTYGPAWSNVSLLERLVGAHLVIVGRSRGLVEDWADPCDGSTQRFAVAEVEVREVLRGKALDLVRIRVAGTENEGQVSPIVRLEKGDELLLVLAEDEAGDVPRYGLQYDSAFPVRDQVLELPDDVPLGGYAEEPGKLTLDVVRRMLDDLAADAEQRRKQYQQVDGPEWESRPYPEVEEIGDPDEKERPPHEAGPRDSQPASERGRQRRSRRPPDSRAKPRRR